MNLLLILLSRNTDMEKRVWVIHKNIKLYDRYAHIHVFEPVRIPVRRIIRSLCVSSMGNCEIRNIKQVEVNGKASNETDSIVSGVL